MTLFVAPHLQQLDKILMPRVNQIFQFLPDDLVPQRRQDSWTFHNGSTIRLDGVSVGRGVRIRGDAVHLAIIDECRDITDLEQLVSSPHRADVHHDQRTADHDQHAPGKPGAFLSRTNSSARRSSGKTSTAPPTSRTRC